LVAVRPEDDGTLLLEQVGHGAVGAQIAAELREAVAHFRHRAVLVVRQRFHQDRHAAGAVTLVGQLFEVLTVGCAGPAGNRTVNRSTGHVGTQGLVDRRAQARVVCHLIAAQLGGHRQLTDDLGENLRPLGILSRLAMLDIGPFTVTRHDPSTSSCYDQFDRRYSLTASFVASFSASRGRSPSSRSCLADTLPGASVSGHAADWVFGNAITSRIELAPVISMISRSRPKARPPWGGAP